IKQPSYALIACMVFSPAMAIRLPTSMLPGKRLQFLHPVSNTHLTLPTSVRVVKYALDGSLVPPRGGAVL
ncbi:hypothetical protein, partial [Proteus mirabilis]|uniref:hypothetical protein n=1 Tax=Proteus mirabilis TaxID=584 RepID=UPI001C63BA1D